MNCAAIPEALIESELFGYEDGAFTGARRKGVIGKIVHAHGGTLFLDEIGDMPLALQARLLRVLQERQVTPLGSHKSQPVDVMLVCATHRNLRELIAQGAFREDLYYRLGGLSVRIPPLRARSDMATLVTRILRSEHPHTSYTVTPEVLSLFARCAWPGNLRQLATVLRTAVAMTDAALIELAHLPDEFMEDAQALDTMKSLTGKSASETNASKPLTSAALYSNPAQDATPDAFLDDTPLEKSNLLPAVTDDATPSPTCATTPASANLLTQELQLIEAAVAQAKGNISAASKRLGISRNTIYRRLYWSRDEGTAGGMAGAAGTAAPSDSVVNAASSN